MQHKIKTAKKEECQVHHDRQQEILKFKYLIVLWQSMATLSYELLTYWVSSGGEETFGHVEVNVILTYTYVYVELLSEEKG